jgi:hypothetical protein
MMKRRPNERSGQGNRKTVSVNFDLFLMLWIAAIASLGAAIWLLSLYFRLLGTDLELNSFRKEFVLALIVSACQTGAISLVLPFMHRTPHTLATGRGVYVVPMLCCALLYKAAHIADWEQYEPMALAFFQGVIALVCGMAVMGQFGFATFVLTGFATALLVIGSIVKQA